MKSALIIFLICYAQLVYGQKGGIIHYILPDSVEILLDKYLQLSSIDAPKSKHYGVLKDVAKDTIELDVVVFEAEKKSV